MYPERNPVWVRLANYPYLRRARGLRTSSLVGLALLTVSLDEAATVEVPAPLAPVHTVVVMVESPLTVENLKRLNAIRSRWRADAAVAVSLPRGAWPRWLGIATRELAFDRALDQAIFVASAEVNGPRPLCIGKKGAFANARLSALEKHALPKLRGVPGALDLLTERGPGEEAGEVSWEEVLEAEMGEAREVGMEVELAKLMTTRKAAAELEQVGMQVVSAAEVEGAAEEESSGEEESSAEEAARRFAVAPLAAWWRMPPRIRRAAELASTLMISKIEAEGQRHQLRHVFVDLYRRGRQVERGVAGERHELRVQIREKGAGVMAKEPLPEPPDWVDGETHMLRVLVKEFGSTTEARADLRLPPHGASSVAELAIEFPNAPEFRARLTVIEKPARILQVLEYRVPIGPAGSTKLARPELTPEVEVRDLNMLDGPRSPVSASVIIGSGAGEDLLDLIRHGEGIAVSLSSFGGLVGNVSALLDDFADGQKATGSLGEGDSLNLLRSLADEGVQLREALSAQWGTALETAMHIQLISADVNKLLPLEVCYDGPAPSSSAKLCTSAVQRLVSGERACVCDKDSKELVCPLRFWGLSRVVERHGPDPSLSNQLGDRTGAFVRSIGKLETLDLRGQVVWAMDSVVDSDGKGGTLKEREKHERTLEKELQSDFVKVGSWNDWASHVNKATRIVAAVVHNDDEGVNSKGLYLNGERKLLGQVDGTLVGPGHPVVLLLGCKTLGPSATSVQPAFRFKIKGVPAVVGTQSPVIGRFAADAAHRLVVLLREQSEKGDATPMGEVIRRARSSLVASGLTTGLALVALGDADQLIGKEA